MDTITTFHDRLKRILDNKSISQGQLARELSESPQKLSNWVTGKNEPPARLVSKIIDRYPEINPTWLLVGTGPMHSNTGSHELPVQADAEKVMGITEDPVKAQSPVEFPEKEDAETQLLLSELAREMLLMKAKIAQLERELVENKRKGHLNTAIEK